MKINDLAVEYVNTGWSVLPVRPDEKRPFMSNWLQYTKTRATLETVNNWFTQLKNAGVGVVTGKISNMVVLDIENDCPYPIEEILKKYPTQMVSRSGSGGYHLFYQYPQNIPRVSNRVRIFDGADLRADGGFIVLPPTKHPSGGYYEWVQRGALGAFPLALLDLKSETATNNEGWITETLRGVSEGGRNDACARLAGYFFKKGINYDVVESLLLEWNERNDPPLPIREVRATIKSIEKSHIMDEKQFTSVDFTNDSDEQQKQSTFDIMKISDYVKGYGGGGVSWAVQDWLPDKSITFLVSPPESYKTWILLDLVVSVATGTPFLGEYAVNKTGAAIVIQQEDSHEGLTDRLALIIESKLHAMARIGEEVWQIPTLPDIPVYIHPSRMLRFDNKKVVDELEEQIKIIRPRVVVIDPLYSTTSVDNYMSATAEQMMVLKTWRDKYGCSFVIAHHSKKNVDPDSTAREDSWGSQFLNAFLEAGWQIRRSQRLAQNEIVVRRHSKVMGNQNPISLTFDISTQYPMKYQVKSQMYTQNLPTNHAPVCSPSQNELLGAMQDDEVTQAEICGRTGKSRSTVSRQMSQLEAAGIVVRMPSGKYKRNDVE